jgi:NADH dehydrogenase [ubiquinone] 1 alpha subcomplex assembly factor 1
MTEKRLFDFGSSESLTSGSIVNDDVMGGVSTSMFQNSTNRSAVFSGTVSLKNSGGFASVRLSPTPGNLLEYDAFSIRVRGDGQRYKLTVRNPVGFNTPSYQCSFTTIRGQWLEVLLPFKNFSRTFRGRILTPVRQLNPMGAYSLGFLISDKQEGPFRLELAWIKAVKKSGSQSKS